MEKEYNKYLWSPKQPRVYGISPLTISGTPMSEEDVATSLKVENSQQRFQQNPVVKRSEQWEAQQKQREEEIAASKKWLELHPEDESDSPYTILERGKHQAIVDGKDPSYYEKMIDDGKQFTKGALSVLSLPYLSAAAAGVYGYGASLGARGLFAAQGIHGLANENGVRKTANLIKSGDYGRAALSGAGDALNAAMVLPGAKLLGNAAKYGLKTTYVADRLANNVRNVTLPYNIYGNDSRRPLSQFIDSNRNGDSNSYWLRTYKYDKHTGKPLDIRNLDGAKFGDGGYGNDGGKIDGTFMSYGEPWQEFAVTPRDAWYKFPNRSSERSATNWKGDKMGYSVKDAYDAELAYRKVGDFMGSIPENTDLYEMGKMRLFERSKYPILEKIPQAGDRYFANQTVIPKHELTYDSFLKQPFWKYTEDPISGQVQQELFMQWPKNNTQGRTYLGLLERPSKLSEAERLGIPKGARNQPDNTALPTRGFDAIPTNKNNFYRVSGPSEITDISEFGKLRIDPIARFDQMQLRIINEQTGIPMERLYEINASDNPRAIQNLVMESEAYKSASPFDQFNMKLSAARPKSNHGDKGFQRGAFFSIYDPNNPASKYYGAPTIVGTTRKSSFLGGHHGDYRGEWNLDIPVGSGQNSGSAVLRSGFEKENFKYWKLGNDGKWYLHNFKQGGILKRVESGKSGIHK